MTAEVIQFSPNRLGYAHAVCKDCGGNSWHVATAEHEDGITFHSLVCVDCGNVVYVEMTPVWGPANR